MTCENRCVSVGPRDEQGPRPAAWALSAVRAGGREPLVVRLDAPIDALDAGYLAVVDEQHRRVAGHAVLLDGETTWHFTPARGGQPTSRSASTSHPTRSSLDS